MMSVIGLTTGLSSFERAWKRFSFNHLFPHNFLFTKKTKKSFWAVGMYEYLHKCLLLQDLLERSKTRKTFKTLV